jgi:hypothetical protein
MSKGNPEFMTKIKEMFPDFASKFMDKSAIPV